MTMETQRDTWREEADRLKAINAQLLEALEVIAEGKGVSKSVLYLLDAAGQDGA